MIPASATNRGIARRVCANDPSHFEEKELDYVPGGSEEAFVIHLYDAILDRGPDAEGYAVQVAALRAGMSPDVIVFNFLNSVEYREKQESASATVERVYQAMLGRASDAEGKAFWLAKMDAGMLLNAVVHGFYQSDEFDVVCRTYGLTSGMR